jgi:hypothetical protein
MKTKGLATLCLGDPVPIRLKKSKNVQTRTFVRFKMSSTLPWGNPSKSVIISNLTSFSASNQVCVPHFYPQIKILIIIPQFSPENKSKSPHQCSTATYVCDFWTKMSSICEKCPHAPRVARAAFPALVPKGLWVPSNQIQKQNRNFQ